MKFISYYNIDNHNELKSLIDAAIIRTELSITNIENEIKELSEEYIKFKGQPWYKRLFDSFDFKCAGFRLNCAIYNLQELKSLKVSTKYKLIIELSEKETDLLQ